MPFEYHHVHLKLQSHAEFFRIEEVSKAQLHQEEDADSEDIVDKAHHVFSSMISVVLRSIHIPTPGLRLWRKVHRSFQSGDEYASRQLPCLPHRALAAMQKCAHKQNQPACHPDQKLMSAFRLLDVLRIYASKYSTECRVNERRKKMKSRILLLIAFVICISTLAESASVPPEAIQDLKWRLLGPLRAGWSMVAEGIPDEPNTYYFGAADGGVWKTTDAGLTWQPIADQAPFSSVQAIAISKNTPRTIYVGTGQVATRYDVMDGTGVYKTTDDGKTWTSLGLSDSRHIGRMLLDPRNDNVIIVAVLGHLFGPNQERGIFRSEDGGAHWQKVLFVDENTGAVDLASDPATPDVIYASTWQVRQYPFQSYFIPQAGPGSGIWKSTDGGKTWAQTSKQGLPQGSLSRIGLAVGAQTQGRRVYAAIEAEKDGGLYRSDDGGG